MTSYRWREKDFNMKVEIPVFPVTADDFPKFSRLPELVRLKQNLTVTIETKGSEDYDQILLSCTGDAFYLEIVYPMDIFGWEHPLILANDSLTAEEAEEVLLSLLVDGTDQTEIIINHFHEISSSIYGK